MPASAEPRWSVHLVVPEAWAETLQYLLQEQGFGLCLAETAYPGGALEHEMPVGRDTELRLVIAAEELPTLESCMTGWRRDCGVEPDAWPLDIRPLDPAREADSSHWQRHWRSFRCAGFVVHPSFVEPAELPLRPGDRPMTILVGSAFGTGGHVTTRMALLALEHWRGRGRRFPRVLDVGTGSGILAVAAAMDGAAQVVGMDPDPQSPPQAAAMAAANGVGERCQFWRGTLTSAAGVHDLVLANLIAELLVEGARDLAARLAPGGRLFTGGVLARRRPSVAAALQDVGLVPCGGLRDGPWRRRGRWCGDLWRHADES
ncbi:MAG: 50S ribosomal protein L11 methyltransferase [Planctomycetota bacterium]|jgi:ribosomal protein L11 methyltransferase